MLASVARLRTLGGMSNSVEGSCVCGAVGYEIERPYRAFQYCHCSRCRKKSGSAFLSNIFVPVDQFQWIRGEDQVKRFELPDAKYWSTAFCRTCGSAVPWLTRNGKVMVVGAGGLDGDPGERPSFSVFYGSRPDWYTHVSDLDTHETLPGR